MPYFENEAMKDGRLFMKIHISKINYSEISHKPDKSREEQIK